jgi:hypothetical protein
MPARLNAPSIVETVLPAALSSNLPDGVPRPQKVKLFANDQLKTPTTALGRDHAKLVNGPAVADAPWGVQLFGGSFANICSSFLSSAPAQVPDCPGIPPAARDSLSSRQERLLVPCAHHRADSCRSRALLRNAARSGRELSRSEELRKPFWGISVYLHE